MVEVVDNISTIVGDDDLLYFLDTKIADWRKILKDINHPQYSVSIYYIDAFQAVRCFVFGERLEN